jgi:hypothetical protein
MGPPQATADATASSEEEVAARHAYLSLARHIRQQNQPICGLWPLGVNKGFEEVPRCLAMALVSLGISVGLVAPSECWRDGTSQARLSISALGEGIDLLTPEWKQRRNVAAAIEQTLEQVRDHYRCILLDLSGLDTVAVREVALLPGLAIVLFAGAGQIGEFALAKIRRRFPAERLMGAVLVDIDPSGAVD